MSRTTPLPSRRMFLRGLGGAALGLPFLEAQARAASAPTPHYAVFLRQANGVAQADNGEPEQYWPRATGRMTRASLAGDGDRALSELADYADNLLFVKGTTFGYPGNGCGHSGGGNQVLTAAKVSTDPSGNLSLAMGESIDNYLAKQFTNNGGEPLTLYSGPRYGYIEEVLSYRGPLDLRPAEDDPWNAYLRMVGGVDTDGFLADRRRSVNDLLRGQMQRLLGRSDLSVADRQRLELHFDSIRDFETLSCSLSENEEQQMASLAGQGTLDDNRLTVAQLHCDLVAIAFSCDHVRAATLQIGDGNDATQYMIGGNRAPSFHQISHRIYSDGSYGDPIVGAIDLHHQIDRMHLQVYRHLLDRLAEHGILDQSIAVHTNDLGAGVSHTYRNVPFIIAGRGDGLLKQGQYVDLGGDVTHNQLLSTLISACGIRKGNGDLVDDFGDVDLPRGTLSALMA
jgi:hypothetical protein